jgi:membrane fusion protein (multidrug efflux system)
MLLMLSVTLIVLSALGLLKYKQVRTGMVALAAYQPPPEAVTTVVATRAAWPASTTVVGSVAAVQGITVSADLPGTVARINFDSGRAVRQGEILVELDTRQERAQLRALEAQRDLARVNYTRMETLVQEGVISRMEYDKASADQRQTDANVAEIRATIERKMIRAPFSGILGIRKVSLGQYLAAGGPVVPLQSLDPIYVNFSIPQQMAAQVKVGRLLQITTKEVSGQAFTGRVTALDSVIDEATRNVQVQATLPNPQGKLRPGMFVEVDLSLGGSRTVISLPASAIAYAPYGDSVFVVTDVKDQNGRTYRGVRQQFVKVEGSRGDQVAIVSGINPGDEVVSSGVFKLHNGSAVQVNNTVKPENNPAPKPEDS